MYAAQRLWSFAWNLVRIRVYERSLVHFGQACSLRVRGSGTAVAEAVPLIAQVNAQTYHQAYTALGLVAHGRAHARRGARAALFKNQAGQFQIRVGVISRSAAGAAYLDTVERTVKECDGECTIVEVSF